MRPEKTARKRNGQAEPEREDEEEEKPERRILLRRDEGQQTQHDRTHAGGRDDSHEQPHGIGARNPLPSAGLLHEGRRHPDVVKAEHGEGEQHEDSRHSRQDPRRLQRGAEETAREGRRDAERGVHRGHAKDVGRCEEQRAPAVPVRLPAEEAHRQRNDGIDAGRQIQGESPAEEQQQYGQEPAALQEIAEVFRAAGRRAGSLEAAGLGEGDGAAGQGSRAHGGGARGWRGRCRREGGRARRRVECDGRRRQALGVAARLELDRAGNGGRRGAAPIDGHLNRKLLRVNRERRFGEGELLCLAFRIPGLAEPGAADGIELQRRRDQVFLGGVVAVDVPAGGQARVDTQRAVALRALREGGVDRQQFRRVRRRRRESERGRAEEDRGGQAFHWPDSLGSSCAMKERTLSRYFEFGCSFTNFR